uniref:TolB family protein n=1 Tax=uncultured Altererythrobacter sp. TaxID=500840 RepID=UPI0026286570|nr:DPP IV N-terminal domain-containing protein [uncultured Altererythrobacter sp.]
MFLQRSDGTAQIRQADADGGRAAILVPGSGAGANPSLSPDQGSVAFAAQGDVGEGAWSIRIVDLETRAHRDLATGAAMIMHPQWSPDGQHISFIRQSEGQWDIFLLDVEGGMVSRLTATADKSEFHPKWSADGTRLVFDRNGPSGDQGTCYQIAEIDMLSRKPAVLLTVEGTARAGAPSYSPDGRAIIFSTSQGQKDGIWKLDLASSETTLLRSRGEGRGVGGPVYSPDGSKIAFHADVDGRFEILVMDADGSRERLIGS